MKKDLECAEKDARFITLNPLVELVQDRLDFPHGQQQIINGTIALRRVTGRNIHDGNPTVVDPPACVPDGPIRVDRELRANGLGISVADCLGQSFRRFPVFRFLAFDRDPRRTVFLVQDIDAIGF